MYVDDLADACQFVLETWKPKKEEIKYLNVGTGSDIEIKKIAEIISSKSGFNGKFIWDKTKPDGTPKKQLDISRILSKGWKPKTSLEKGLDLTIKDYRTLNDKNLVRK